ncbi:amidohydrolase family protein, partial [Salmonella enterica subsp. enterica serovar Infantis]
RAAEPGLLLHGGPIYTGREDAPRAEAVLTRGKRIVFVGALSEARALAAGAREIDLKGAAAYPGFVDAHAHMTEIGLQSFVLDLTGTTSVADLQ